MSDGAEDFRAWLRRYDGDHAHLADRDADELRTAVEGAREWVAGRRWSVFIVARNFLLDGRYHA